MQNADPRFGIQAKKRTRWFSKHRFSHRHLLIDLKNTHQTKSMA